MQPGKETQATPAMISTSNVRFKPLIQILAAVAFDGLFKFRPASGPPGHATGEYQDFLTGFVLPDGHVWGRPVGITVAPDGSLLVSDDGSNSIWRVSYVGK